ncbi:hypothetical protein [Tenacibaculum ascidiaceicola]|uniref:hypothetical protein n=1 Tax=Tenacibaculum ascidiaceicola TaxID=1699411 RepID=UPI0038943544
MKKQILNLGKTLKNSEQKEVYGGFIAPVSHYTVTCTVSGGGDVNSVSEANDLIRECQANGGRATIRSNY